MNKTWSCHDLCFSPLISNFLFTKINFINKLFDVAHLYRKDLLKNPTGFKERKTKKKTLNSVFVWDFTAKFQHD